MARAWTHVGRLWTNGDSFLALDGDLLPHWRGLGDGTYQSVIVGLSWEVTSVAVGPGAAGLIAIDPEVADEGWLEVFRSDDAVAVVQAVTEDQNAYGAAVTAALEHLDVDDELGDQVEISSGKLVFLSAALDGVGPDSPPMQPEAPGSIPDTWPDATEGGEAAGLVLDVGPKTYRLRTRWLTELDGGAFARWLLISDLA